MWIGTEQDYQYLEEVTRRTPREIEHLKSHWSESNDIKNWLLYRRQFWIDETAKVMNKPEYQKRLPDYMKFLDMYFSPAYASGRLPNLGEIGKQE